MNNVIRIFSMLLVLIVSAPNAFAEIKLSNALVKDIGRAYGFYLGQNYSLSEISKTYPSLSGLALIAQEEFSVAFKSSIDGMDALMAKYGKSEWNKIKKNSPNKLQILSILNKYQKRKLVSLLD
ncbi:hypothetical protein [endosymbiont of unidentified scaly snail isolate Monju]|uniref:hypothetical protein n=1 Tax=endosymbiont of unidentified scaly snail isolate Monju TaxID=1248727 RepID=UPI0011DE4E59|nr:hypothetical protein [endosymbiont of unidentified scaly snail isolate Monju]